LKASFLFQLQLFGNADPKIRMFRFKARLKTKFLHHSFRTVFKKSILTRDLRETIKGKFSYELVKSIQKQILTVNPSKALLKIAEQLQAVIQIFFCIHWQLAVEQLGSLAVRLVAGGAKIGERTPEADALSN
jgi:hypothetical protein